MSYVEEYKGKLVTPEEAAKIVKSGDWVDYGSFNGSATVLDKALAARKDELWDVKIRGLLRLGTPEVVKADPAAQHFIYHSWHLSGPERKLNDQGLCWYVPMLYHELPGYYRQFVEVDVAFIAVGPMDENGYFNFGPQVSHTMAVCEKAKKIVIEVNPNMPRCLGGEGVAIHISQVDLIVEVDWAMVQLPSAAPSEVDKQIAEKVINELEDGSCLQLGIGGMPNAVGALIPQSGLKDLGIHTEMFVDSMVDMIEAGVITGARKNLDKHKVSYTFAVGTQKTYDFLNNNPLCAAYPVDYINDPFVIAQNDKVMAINNSVEIDLFGQVCSESSGTRQISGTGGQLDFIFGANRSKGGKGFICMASTFKKGDKLASRIKPILTPGATVTTPRTMTSYLVTEYGIVNLKGMSMWQRAEAIISLAHPDFRDELIKEAEKIGVWRKSNTR